MLKGEEGKMEGEGIDWGGKIQDQSTWQESHSISQFSTEIQTQGKECLVRKNRMIYTVLWFPRFVAVFPTLACHEGRDRVSLAHPCVSGPRV